MSRIFISHSSKDDHAALAIREWLAAEGWAADSDVYLDIHPQSGMAAGQRWLDALEEAAGRCEAVVFLISETWLNSKWCGDELRLALSFNKKIFSLLIDDINLTLLPVGLTAEWQVVRLQAEPGAEQTRRFRTNHPITNEPGTAYFAEDGLRRLANGLKKAGIAADTFELQTDKSGPFGWRMPYRGLAPLQEDDAAVFFGRDADLIRGIDQLRGLVTHRPPRMWVILGASGSGKSSFLRAGLIPRLRRDDASWIAMPALRVADHGAIDGEEGLIAALVSAAEQMGESVSRADLHEAIATPDRFITHLQDLRKTAARRLLMSEGVLRPMPVLAIDQAEELAYSDAQPEAGRLLELVHRALDAGELLLVTTIRSDSYDLLQNNPHLVGVVQATFSLPTIAQGEIGKCIRGPAEVLRAKVGPEAPLFSAEVMESLQREVESEADALPLIAFALERLMRNHTHSAEIGLDELAATGGVSHAIETAATEALAHVGLTNPQHARDALQRLFVPWLVRIDPASRQAHRRVAPMESVVGSGNKPLLDALLEKRLLVSDKTDGAVTVEVAHEALLRRWQVLGQLLDDERESLLRLDAIKRAAHEWRDADHATKEGYLLHRSQRLAEAENMLARPDYARDIKAEGSDYIASCRKAEDEALAQAREQETENKRLETEKIEAQRQAAEDREHRAVEKESATRRFAWTVGALSTVAFFVLAIAGSFIFMGKMDLALSDSKRNGRLAEDAYNVGEFSSAMRIALASIEQGAGTQAALITKWTLARAAFSSLVLAELGDHTAAVTHASFSPNGTQILTRSADNTAHVWRADEDGVWQSKWLDGHGDPILQAIFSPNGSRIVTTARKTARVWHADPTGVWQSEQELITPWQRAEDPDNVLALYAAFSPNSEQIVTTSTGRSGWGVVWQRDAAGVWQSKPLKSNRSQGNSFLQPTFSPDGSQILVTSVSYGRVWEPAAEESWQPDQQRSPISNWEQVRTWQPDQQRPVNTYLGEARQAAFSPDGTLIVFAGSEGRVGVIKKNTEGVWNTITPELLVGHESAIRHVAFSPDSTRIVSASEDSIARVWQVHAEGWQSQALEGHNSTVNHAAFSPDGTQIVTASDDATARVWQTDAGGVWRSQTLVGHSDGVLHAAFSPDGSLIATASRDSKVLIWPAETDKVWQSQLLAGPVLKAAFSPDGAQILTTSEGSTARVWQADAEDVWQSQSLKGHNDPILDAAFSQNGTQIVTTTGLKSQVWRSDVDGIWLPQPDPVDHSDSVNNPSSYAASSLDGSQIITSSSTSAQVWKADTDGVWRSQLLVRGQGATVPIDYAVFSPDGTQLATSGQNEDILWKKTAAGVWRWQPQPLNVAMFSPDGEQLVTTSGSTAEIWQANDRGYWQTRGILVGHSGTVNYAAFSPDGVRIVTTSDDSTARVWQADAEGIWRSRRLDGHSDKVSRAAFSSDGNRIVTASEDSTARVWQVDAGGIWRSQSLVGHSAPVREAIFSPDGLQIITASADKTGRVWSVSWLSFDQTSSSNFSGLFKNADYRQASQICKEKLRGTLSILLPSDTDFSPGLTARLGEDVCAPFRSASSQD